MLDSEMLTIRAAKGPDYYERAEFARDDYYEERGQLRGSWEGTGAEVLGLSGAPGDGALGELLEGRDPSTGTELAGTGQRRGGNVAFDLTFTAPKSVSVLAAVGDESIRQAVLAAQADGARAGLDYLERRACFVRRGRNGVTVLPGQGFAGAMYLHEMARSGDPHVHAHVVIANRVKGPDGRWSAPDMRPVFAEAKTAGTIAEAAMRDALSRSLGVGWGPLRNGIAELAGVPARVCEHFSQRHAEIVEEATARGYVSARGIDVIQRETRDRKRVVSRERAASQWRARAAEHGFGARELAALIGRSRGVDAQEQRAALEACRSKMLGPAGLTQRSAHFTRREVIQALAEAHPGGAAACVLEALADQFIATSCVSLLAARVEANRGHQEALFSTPDMLRCEARLLATASGVDPRGGIVAARSAVDGAISARPTLGSDQAAAVRHLCLGDARVRVMEAGAGTGKTFALEAVREAYESSHIPVIGVAWQGQAADVLQRDAGIQSETAALLLDRLARGDTDAIPAGAVIVCDEASMMPTRALERLASEAAQRCARLILVGDRAQLPAIDAAGGFAALADRLGSAELTENRRQRTDLQRQVAERLADGRPADALALLADHDRLHAFDDGREARAALVAAWAQASLADPARGLILAHDRHEVATLNLMARRALDDAGLLGPSRLTASGREWAAGDRVVCRRNDYRVGVRNGTRGTVVQIDSASKALLVRVDDAGVVRLPEGYLDDVQYGYALTGHISQGATVDRTFLSATPERGGREWAYVASSRQRVDLTLFAVHHEPEQMESALARSWARSDAKRLALDHVEGPSRSTAVDAARSALDAELPERRAARLRDLSERREQARGRAGATSGEEAAGDRLEAQILSAELRQLAHAGTAWTVLSEIAHPSPRAEHLFGPRPTTTLDRQAWEAEVTRAVAAHPGRDPERAIAAEQKDASGSYRER
ncbi:MobF family relaxase [Miltoncostaea oceani]|uniref:MobF family relaxase n=1 Tax=Miltoncostaea oceani TaxID=2843216 RepID=UPI001C3DD5A7|nr:MobF family relaxase [Miltoncostaea oceani]